MLSFFDEKGRARHLLLISRKIHQRVANFFYWNGHYAPITSIEKLFYDITKQTESKDFSRRCLGHFSSKEVFAIHKELCTWDDFMSVLHLFPTPKSKQSQLKCINFKFCTIAPIVFYADIGSILEPLGRQANLTTYTQHSKVCAASVFYCSTLGQYT